MAQLEKITLRRLCLHGFPDNAHSWRHQLPALAEAGYRAVAVTLRGYEPASQPADGDYSLHSLAGDVIAFMDEFGEQKAHLIGHDWGAGIAYTACSVTPDKALSGPTATVLVLFSVSIAGNSRTGHRMGRL
jgi:pimeloyl-ACP methyl ester carboxylesterase